MLSGRLYKRVYIRKTNTINTLSLVRQFGISKYTQMNKNNIWFHQLLRCSIIQLRQMSLNLRAFHKHMMLISVVEAHFRNQK